jgi:hypothetical protein
MLSRIVLCEFESSQPSQAVGLCRQALTRLRVEQCARADCPLRRARSGQIGYHSLPIGDGEAFGGYGWRCRARPEGTQEAQSRLRAEGAWRSEARPTSTPCRADKSIPFAGGARGAPARPSGSQLIARSPDRAQRNPRTGLGYRHALHRGYASRWRSARAR